MSAALTIEPPVPVITSQAMSRHLRVRAFRYPERKPSPRPVVIRSLADDEQAQRALARADAIRAERRRRIAAERSPTDGRC
jgi:hypothetical protein